jgi:spectinomycin phosphotransferase
VRERPPHLGDPDVLLAARRHWDDALLYVEHLPVGFGAHHWAAYDDTGPRLFVTWDGLEPRHSPESLEAAYAGAAALRAAGLEFVLAPLQATTSGSCTVPLAGGVLSCTPWVAGRSGGPLDVAWTAAALARLHATPPPPGLPRWRPLVGTDFADVTAALTRRAWGPGPHAEAARDVVRRHLADVERWTHRYHDLAQVARARDWVATHGEPHSGNQLLTRDGRVLVDWESLKLAPAELDLRTLADGGGRSGADVGADTGMLELFDLEWRLDEIGQYAARFAAPHSGGPDDEIAIEGLHHELERA